MMPRDGAESIDDAAQKAGHICILMNAKAGHQGDSGLCAAVRRFAEARPGVELREIGKGRDLARQARLAAREGYGTIVAAGGDGTIRAVAQAIHGSGARLGVLPLGTFNYFARGLGIPLEIEAALALLDRGAARDLAVAEVNGELFLNNASLGVYPAILQRREDVYRRWGRSRLAAYWSVLLTLAGFKQSRRMKVVIDGQVLRRKTPLIFVARSAYQLEEFGLPGAEICREGRLAVFLTPDLGRWGLLRYAVRLMGRSIQRHRDIELIAADRVEIESRGRHLVAHDGEKSRMRAPIRIEIRPEPLQVLAPETPAQ